MLKKLKNILYKWYTSDTVDMMEYVHPYSDSGIKKVAAGDPSLGAGAERSKSLSDELTLTDGTIINTADYETFDVEGTSMSPEDIQSGDVLLCKPADISAIRESTGKFVIIEVDPEYYKWKDKALRFNYKLRKTLAVAKKSDTVDGIIKNLSKFDDSILLEKNKICLREKLSEARRYYQDIDLMISITYKKGELRYSLHPLDLIKYEATVHVKLNEDETYEAIELTCVGCELR